MVYNVACLTGLDGSAGCWLRLLQSHRKAYATPRALLGTFITQSYY